MAHQHTRSTDGALGLAEYAIMSVVLVSFLAMWAVFVTSPPAGLVSPFGMVLSFVAGAYLAFVAFSYLKNNVHPSIG